MDKQIERGKPVTAHHVFGSFCKELRSILTDHHAVALDIATATLISRKLHPTEVLTHQMSEVS